MGVGPAQEHITIATPTLASKHWPRWQIALPHPPWSMCIQRDQSPTSLPPSWPPLPKQQRQLHPSNSHSQAMLIRAQVKNPMVSAIGLLARL